MFSFPGGHVTKFAILFIKEQQCKKDTHAMITIKVVSCAKPKLWHGCEGHTIYQAAIVNRSRTSSGNNIYVLSVLLST